MPSLLLALVAPSLAVTPPVTYPVQFRAFCSSGSNVCGYGSETELTRIALEKLNEVNAIWVKTGVSFRPADPSPVLFTYDTDYELVTGSDGASLDPAVPNQDLTDELIATYSAADPEEITVFLMPNLHNLCWSGYTGGGNTTVFCQDNWVGDGGQVIAHELGHLLGLPHTFTGQDPANNSPVEHDGDDSVVFDTPADPWWIEVGDKAGDDVASGSPDVKSLHDYCNATLQSGADPGSPKDSWCTIACYEGTGSGMGGPIAYQPYSQNLMAYYGGVGFTDGQDELAIEGCFGPYVVDGWRYEPLTSSQIARIGDTVKNVAKFDEMCGSKGGDTDRDGICNQEDLCPASPETWLDWRTADVLFLPPDLDPDGDLIPSHCDLCPNDPVFTDDDQDGDGIGDPCDDDIDGDGCANEVDEDPTSDTDVVGHYIGYHCGGRIEAYAGDDPDGDGLPNCEDKDDDGDGLSDTEDPCRGTSSKFCILPCSGKLERWWDVCIGGGCVEDLLEISSRINPDPTRFEHIQVVGDTIYAEPLAGHTLSESVLAAAGAASRGTVSLDLVGETGVHVTSFEPESATVLDLFSGHLVAIRIGERGDVTISTANGVGSPLNEPTRRAEPNPPAKLDPEAKPLELCPG